MFDKCFGHRYIEPYEVLERIRPVAYKLGLPPSLAGVHNVFHVSQLRKCTSNPDAMIETNQPEVQPNLTIPERPVRILDRAKKAVRRKTIPVMKVLWSGQTEREATWELEDAMRRKYPELFL